MEFASKIIRVGTGANRKRIKLQLWDTAGTERFRSVSRSYYRGSAGAILVYDVASVESFNALPTFLSDARALASPHLTVIVAGNKIDIEDASNREIQIPRSSGTGAASTASSISQQSSFPYDAGSSVRSNAPLNVASKWSATVSDEGREVTAEMVSRWAARSKLPVTMEVSALSGDNVEALFTRLASMILTRIELGEIDPDDPQSGIQYGDGGGAWNSDMASVKSGITLEGESVRRRRKSTRNAWTRSAREWGEVFSLGGTASRGSRGCC